MTIRTWFSDFWDDLSGEVKLVVKVLCFLLVVLFIVAIIIFFTSINTIDPEEQVVIDYLNGKEVVNGPTTKILNPFRDKEWRKSVRISKVEYAILRDELKGTLRVVEGPGRFFMEAYETLQGQHSKIVLAADQYIRLIHKLTGEEEVKKGPQSFAPDPWQNNGGIQQAAFVSPDEAAWILNKATGQRKVEKVSGTYFPKAYEVIESMTKRVRVMPYEIMVTRDIVGRYVYHDGAGGATADGTSFFTGPFDKIISFTWSRFSEPVEGQLQEISQTTVSVVDTRARRTFFQYDVRTKDNVNMRVEGSIFWRIVNVPKMVSLTADPVGDVWYKSRNVLVGAVSQTDLRTFVSSVNTIISDAQTAQANDTSDTFYEDRGLVLNSIELTKYGSTEESTNIILQQIIEEKTARINLLKEQETRNIVEASQLAANVEYENRREALVVARAVNEKKLAQQEGTADGTLHASTIDAFLKKVTDGNHLTSDEGLGLFDLEKFTEHQNDRVTQIAQQVSTIFARSEDLNLDTSMLQASMM